MEETWLKVYTSLPGHKKTRRLKRLLKCSNNEAVGLLVTLWLWAEENAEDGELTGFLPEEIAEVVGYSDKRADKLLQALVDAGFLDREGDRLLIHDWYDYVGALMNKRDYNARQRVLYKDTSLTKAVKARDGNTCQYCGITVNWKDRRGMAGGTYDHIDPQGDNTPENICVCCRSCSSKKNNRTPQEAGMNFVKNSWFYSRNICRESTGNLPETYPESTKEIRVREESSIDPSGKPSGSTQKSSLLSSCAGVREEGDGAPLPPQEEDIKAVMTRYMNDVNCQPSRGCTDDLKFYTQQLGPDLVLHAIDIAIDNNKRQWDYIKGILQNYLSSGFKTMAQVQANEQQRAAAKAARAKAAEQKGKSLALPSVPPQPAGPKKSNMERLREISKMVSKGETDSHAADAPRND